MKLVFAGGGSTYTPALLHGFFANVDDLALDEVALVDIDDQRLKAVGRIVADILAEEAPDTTLLLTPDRKTALADADLVIIEVRPGGTKGRINDETIPLRYGVIAQESIGAGGFSFALRTVPVVLDIARDISEVCPNAWTIVMSNPTGILLEAITRNTDIRAFGLCDVPVDAHNALAEMARLNPREVYLDYVGLNHAGYVKGAYHRSENFLPEILYGELGKNWDEKVMGFPLKMVRDLGAVPCQPYMQYYLLKNTMLSKLQAAETPRGVAVKKWQEKVFKLTEEDRAKAREELLQNRKAPLYGEIVGRAMAAVLGKGDPGIHYVDTPNRGAVPGFTDDVIVEVPCYLSENGPVPITTGQTPEYIRGFLETVKAYELNTVEAAVTNSREAAIKALVAHPLVGTYDVAAKLYEDIIAANDKL